MKLLNWIFKKNPAPASIPYQPSHEDWKLFLKIWFSILPDEHKIKQNDVRLFEEIVSMGANFKDLPYELWLKEWSVEYSRNPDIFSEEVCTKLSASTFSKRLRQTLLGFCSTLMESVTPTPDRQNQFKNICNFSGLEPQDIPEQCKEYL
jgi:hypothetical protein